MKGSDNLFLKSMLGFVLVLSLGTARVMAQGDPPDNGGPTPPTPPPDPAGIPIDGGASLLLAGGVAYGLKKLRDSRRNK